MEIAPGLHRIEAPLGDRFVATYLLVGAEDALLIDTGMDDTPRTYIAPYLDAIDVPLAKIRYVLTSHADFDHTAGNASLKELVPGALWAWTGGGASGEVSRRSEPATPHKSSSMNRPTMRPR